jgi:hypothetical protein
MQIVNNSVHYFSTRSYGLFSRPDNFFLNYVILILSWLDS